MLPTIVTVNPFMAKHKHKRKHAKHHRHDRRAHYRAHHATRRHRRRRSPNPFSTRGLMGQLAPVLVGAGGAIATDVGMAYAAPYLPAAMQSGWLNILTRAAAAVGVGWIAGKAFNRDVGKSVTAGGLIVVAYSGLKQALAPTLGTSIKGLSGLADFGDYMPAYSGQSAAMMGAGLGAYMQPRLGAYMQPRLGAYMNPAAFLNAPSASPIAAKQKAMAGFGGFGGYDSESM